MKKLIFGLIATVMLGIAGNAHTTKHNPKTGEGDKGRVHIHYKGGFLCWMGGSGCEGDIDVQWRTSAPKDIKQVIVPVGYSLIEMHTLIFEKADVELPERTFTKDETSDFSTIIIPKQMAYYSKEIDAFVVYALVK